MLKGIVWPWPCQEEERQRRLVDQAQQQEMMEVEQAQRAQFLGFSNAWDKYLDGILQNFSCHRSIFLSDQ